MEDIQLILYIIFVVIALIARAFKSKNKSKSAPKPNNQSTENNPKPKPKSFEDLLREFENKSTTQSTTDTTDDQEYSEFETDYPTDDEIEKVYQESVNDAKELKTIDELVDLEDDRHTGNFKHFDNYWEEEDVENEYQKLLNTSDGARQAFILSEIINKKYN